MRTHNPSCGLRSGPFLWGIREALQPPEKQRKAFKQRSSGFSRSGSSGKDKKSIFFWALWRKRGGGGGGCCTPRSMRRADWHLQVNVSGMSLLLHHRWWPFRGGFHRRLCSGESGSEPSPTVTCVQRRRRLFRNDCCCRGKALRSEDAFPIACRTFSLLQLYSRARLQVRASAGGDEMCKAGPVGWLSAAGHRGLAMST